jgi:cytochrome c peroxidase
MKHRLSFVALIFAFVAAGLLFWYAASRGHSTPIPNGAVVQIRAPLGLPAVPYPEDNPPTAESIELGRQLYYDASLSVDNTVSCATCHDPGKGFSDANRVSTGVNGKTGVRNSSTVLNAAYYSTQFWDGRAASLEKQSMGPVENPVEMAHTLTGVERHLNADPLYRAKFEKVFGKGPITYDMVAKCIASFERTIVSGDSAFDRWYYGHDEAAVSDSVKRGFAIFRDTKKGNCAVCHTVDEKSALFTDNKFHNIGVGVKDEQITDLGRFQVTNKDEDRGAFKTPSLRNVALTAPYMHDGSLKTLKEVVDFYIGGTNSNPHLDKEIHTLDHLTGQERQDLQKFLESLTGTMPANTDKPAQVQSQAKGD